MLGGYRRSDGVDSDLCLVCDPRSPYSDYNREKKKPCPWEESPYPISKPEKQPSSSDQPNRQEQEQEQEEERPYPWTICKPQEKQPSSSDLPNRQEDKTFAAAEYSQKRLPCEHQQPDAYDDYLIYKASRAQKSGVFSGDFEHRKLFICEICYTEGHHYFVCPYKYQLPPGVPINEEFATIFCSSCCKFGGCPCPGFKQAIVKSVLTDTDHLNLPSDPIKFVLEDDVSSLRPPPPSDKYPILFRCE